MAEGHIAARAAEVSRANDDVQSIVRDVEGCRVRKEMRIYGLSGVSGAECVHSV